RVQNARATIHQVADEDGLAALGVSVGPVAPVGRIAIQCCRPIAELLEQGFKLVAAAVKVPDDVEGTVFLPLVVPEWYPLDRGRFDLLGAGQHEHVTEAFPSEATQGA